MKLLKMIGHRIMLIILIISALVAFNIQSVKAIETIYIRANGSIEPSSAPIQRNGNTYILTADIDSDFDGVIVEKDNIMIDGASHCLQGTEAYDSRGITAVGRSNVTIKDLKIRKFDYGIYLENSAHNKISGVNITTTYYGMWLFSSSNNAITLSAIEMNSGFGMGFLSFSNSNNITKNSIINNGFGLGFDFSSGNNRIFHNNFINNTNQVYLENLLNVWDDGYPSGGNYWSNYTGTDQFSGPSQNQPGSDGIGDTPHILDISNKDNYPLMNPWTNILIINVVLYKTVIGQGYFLPINVTVKNQGYTSETFNVTLYYNTTTVISTQRITLLAQHLTTVTFSWNTADVEKDNYIISAFAWPILGERYTLDNSFTDGSVVVAMVGDLTGGSADLWDFVPDGVVDGSDLIVVSRCFGSWPQAPPPLKWHPNCDITNDKTIDGSDLIVVARRYGKSDP